MKKTIITLAIAIMLLTATSAFMIKSSNGIQGYTGSPGEATCSNCHSGGTSAASGITITSVPVFSMNLNSELEYMPDSIYEITVEVTASGFTRYGFSSQILNSSNTNAGVLQNAGTGVKFLNAGAKRTATHTAPKTLNSLATFTYKWKAPSSGEATIYAIGNAVNGNGNTSGDFVLAPVNMALVAAPSPTPQNPVGINENVQAISRISVFPNPASDLTTISYFLVHSKIIEIQLIDMKGTLVKQLYSHYDEAGSYSQILNLQGVASGVYFIKTSADNQKVGQKLITVQ